MCGIVRSSLLLARLFTVFLAPLGLRTSELLAKNSVDEAFGGRDFGIDVVVKPAVL